jgi:hypothetical protein
MPSNVRPFCSMRSLGATGESDCFAATWSRSTSNSRFPAKQDRRVVDQPCGDAGGVYIIDTALAASQLGRDRVDHRR